MIDTGRLATWMDGLDLAKGEPIEAAFISGGTQNEIYEIRRGDIHAALRIPPPEAPAARDDGIVREWRIIEALTGTDVPCTPAIAVCTDPAVLGRTFYLMGFIEGWSPMALAGQGWPAPFDADLDARRGLAFALVDGIALLSKVDWQARGLGDLGRPDGFHERQVDRWTAFLERIKGRELPGFDEASAWLRGHQPLDYVPGIMHGDYHLSNVMIAPDGPRVAAIVDWEMCTIGDPLLDLGWLLATWPIGPGTGPAGSPADDDSMASVVTGALGNVGGLPTPDELVAHYAERSDRDTTAIGWYTAMACFKLGIVLEGTHARACAGRAPKPTGDMLHAITLGLFARARTVIAKG